MAKQFENQVALVTGGSTGIVDLVEVIAHA
jgi:hypothetical protein